MYYCDFKYSKNNVLILSSDIFTKNKIQKGLLDIKIFSFDGTPIDNANIRVFAPYGINEYIINIDTLGYYPVQIDNIQFYPGSVNKLNVNLIPAQSKDQTSKLDQRIIIPSYNNIQIFPTESELPQDEIRELTMSLGMVTPKGSPSYLYAEKFAEEVNNLSNGKIKIDINTDGKLGADRQMLQNILNDGNIDLIVQTVAPQAEFMPKLSIFDMPMVYTNTNDLRKVINNTEFYEKISDIYKSGGYKLLGFSDPLFKQLTTNKEIQNIDDFNGIKIRTIQNKNHEEFWKLLGAILVPLPFSEIYTSLRHGFIDSADNPYENIIALKLYEQQKYLINTNHLPHLVNLITSDKYYNSLSAAEKAIIDEAAVNATAYAREKADERFEEEKKILIDNGMTILDLPYETKQAIRSKSIPIYERIRELVDDDELIKLYFGNGE
ncbi:MAG: TRAP transporter substrate-binding protein [Sedimentibacter sp.]